MSNAGHTKAKRDFVWREYVKHLTPEQIVLFCAERGITHRQYVDEYVAGCARVRRPFIAAHMLRQLRHTAKTLHVKR